MRERVSLCGGELHALRRVPTAVSWCGPGCRSRGAAMTLRVLVADDQALVRAGFRGIVAATPGFTVVGEAGQRERGGRAGPPAPAPTSC